MSIYSGFSTRNQESAYGKLCEDLISILAARVLQALKSEIVNDNLFHKSLISIYTKMGKLELHKYLPPKLSQSCTKLAIFCAKLTSFSESESSKYFSPMKFEHELPLIQERPAHTRRRSTKSNLQKGYKTSSPPDRAPPSFYNSNTKSEKSKRSARNNKSPDHSPECVQLNDGMFYRLI